MQLGLVIVFVPGATPNKPASGLIANKCVFPVFGSTLGLIQAISSPIVVTFQPSNPAGGINIAKFVFPHAEGKAAAT